MPRLNRSEAEQRLVEDSGPDFLEALARGLRVIEAFNRERRQLTLSDVARVVDLPRASVRRTLATLVRLGYAETDDRVQHRGVGEPELAGRHRRQHEPLQIGNRQAPVARIAHQHRHDLRERLGEADLRRAASRVGPPICSGPRRRRPADPADGRPLGRAVPPCCA